MRLYGNQLYGGEGTNKRTLCKSPDGLGAIIIDKAWTSDEGVVNALGSGGMGPINSNDM